jgi:hypothetical protein
MNVPYDENTMACFRKVAGRKEKKKTLPRGSINMMNLIYQP